jgi:tetratricopeptide (TPR) repeat protein
VSSVGLLASSYGEQGRFSEAEGHHIDQVRRSLTIFGPEHVTTFASKHHPSLLYMHTERLPEVLVFARAAHDGQMAMLGEGHLDTIFSLMTHGGITLRSKKHSTAKQALRRAARVFTGQLGENHLFTYRAWKELAAVFTGAGYPEASKKVYEKVLGKIRDTIQPGHHDMMLAEMELGRLYLQLLEFSAAQDHLLIATKTWSEQYGDGSAVCQEALLDLATAHEGLGRTDLALQTQQRVFEANADQVVKRVHLLMRYREAAQRFWNVGQFPDTIRVQRHVVEVAQSMSALYAEDAAYLEESENRHVRLDHSYEFDA